MAVNLSPYGGVGAQFFSNNGVPLAGGKIFTYAAGTTTPQATYTSASGSTAHANPIILDAAGRVPGGEIWLTDGLSYKFVLKDANDITLATYDNVVGINSNFINYTNEQEIQTATAGQTVFTLTTMQYQPGTGSLSVFVDGVNQYGPGAQYAYVETDSTTVTFVTGLHVGASVKFTTAAINASSYGDAFQISYTPPFTGSVATNVGDKLAQTVSVTDFGAVGDGVADDTAAITAAFNALKLAGGGDLLFPTGDYRFNIDVSGVNPRMQWVGQGAVTFRPYLAAPIREWIIYANNSSGLGTAYGINIIFRNITFTGRFLGDVDPQYGRVGACVWLSSSWATFYDCTFTYGINAGFYSLYGQYNEFYSCSFGANVSGATTAGCLLDSNTDTEAANENTFIRCKFNTNKNGLVIKGGLNNRIISCQFQNTVAGGVAALVLDADNTGFGTNQNWIAGNYFEVNSRDVHIGVAPGQTFEGNIFLPGTILATHTYDLRFIGNTSYGSPPVPDFNHPAGNADVASLTWIGNNFEPDTAGLAHAGPTYLNIQGAQTRFIRNDNQLVTTGQTEANTGTTLVAGLQYGFKGNIARTVATNIFKITQETYATLPVRYSAFEVVLEAVNDENVTTQFGYCSRLDKFHVFITNNTTGAPQVYISNLTGGVDTGINPAFAAIGQITLAGSVSGDQITFSAQYSGAGTSPTSLATINVGYRINYTGGNPVTFTRL